jgi:MurNAc alpha-1-phosphate uridylyltransferase
MSLNTAMVLAAGLGTRMRPLTDACPKALIHLDGRPLIDHMLERLLEGGVRRCVVNSHYCAELLEAHLTTLQTPEITFSRELAQPLETGGALKKARPLLGEDPIFVANTDSVWQGGAPAAHTLAQAWDPARMDALLLVVPLGNTLGFDGAGDFFLEADGRLRFRGDAPSAPLAFMGLHICKPQVAYTEPDEAFSLSRVWRRLADEGRLFGALYDGFWMHVGDPEALAAAEAYLQGGGPHAASSHAAE